MNGWMQITRNLFRWTKAVPYADYYERMVLNGVMGLQRGQQAGVMIYMLPLGPGTSKAKSFHGWGTKFDSFWCCYGSGDTSISSVFSLFLPVKFCAPAISTIEYMKMGHSRIDMCGPLDIVCNSTL